MRLNTENSELYRSNIQQSEDFSIGDIGFVLEILRNKLYSDITKAICQEYSCNARDAHREIGKEDVPIVISLPNALDPVWRCRDYGPGISPERMSNVFIRYAVSTKRDSNTQTGAFGIGAKCAFGYTDTFTIVTFIDSVKRTYVAVIDETKKGQLSLMATDKTDEPNGTEIQVPVKHCDFSNFAKQTEKACRNWKVKPIINNLMTPLISPQEKAIVKGNKWFVTPSNEYYQSLVVLLDGVEYQIDRNDYGIEIPFGSNTTTYLEFETGSMMISANREKIEKTNDAIFKIKERIRTIREEMPSLIAQKMESAKTFKEAILLKEKMNKLWYCRDEKLCWNEILVPDARISISGAVISTYKKELHGGGNIVIKKSKYDSGYLEINENSLIARCSTHGLNVKDGVKEIFKANPNVIAVQIISVDDKRFNDNNLHLLDILTIENFTRKAARKRVEISRMNFFVYNGYENKFNISSFKKFEEEPNKIWCTISGNNGTASLAVEDNIYNINSNITKHIKTITGKDITLFAVKSNVAKEKLDDVFEGLATLNSTIEGALKKEPYNLDQIKAYLECDDGYEKFPLSEDMAHQLLARKQELKNSKFSELIETCNSLKTITKNLTEKFGFLKTTERGYYYGRVIPKNITTIPNEAIKIATLYNELVAEHPMLKAVLGQIRDKSTGSFERFDAYSITVKEIIDYINLTTKEV